MSVTFHTVNFLDYGNKVCELLKNQNFVSKNNYEIYMINKA